MGLCRCWLILLVVLVIGLPFLALAMEDTLYFLVTDAIYADCKDAHTASFDPNVTLPWSQNFRAGWKDIRDELHAWEKQGGYIPPLTDIEPNQVMQAPHKTWKSLWLQLYGRQSKATRHFPRTMAMLAKTPVVSAMFSILEAGQGLELHRGDFKGLLRYHVNLEVPPPAAGETEFTEPLVLAVATKARYKNGDTPVFKAYYWEEGGEMLFDDTFWHKVENKRSVGRKVVLFMDVPRTDCSPWLNTLLDVMTRHVAKLIPRITTLIGLADQASEEGEQALKGRGDMGKVEGHHFEALHGYEIRYDGTPPHLKRKGVIPKGTARQEENEEARHGEL